MLTHVHIYCFAFTHDIIVVIDRGSYHECWHRHKFVGVWLRVELPYDFCTCSCGDQLI